MFGMKALGSLIHMGNPKPLPGLRIEIKAGGKEAAGSFEAVEESR